MLELRVPGDKSIGHRWLMVAALAEGCSRLSGLPDSADMGATIRVLRSVGARITGAPPDPLVVEGPMMWRTPSGPLDCGNSATTARLLIGLLAGAGREALVTGDASLRRRPMDRVAYPLQAMGARIRYLEATDHVPVLVEGRASGSLRPLRYRPRVSSAQVRSALLLAAVASRTGLEVIDRRESRDHTERVLAHLGAPVLWETGEAGLRVAFDPEEWDGSLSAFSDTAPGDLSSAAFLIVAALLSGRSVRVRSVGLNPGRVGFLEVIRGMGADVRTTTGQTVAGEPVGDIEVRPGSLRPFRIGEDLVPRIIDELPALAVLATRADGVSEIRGAGELRYKESDRLRQLRVNLECLGVPCEETSDGLRVGRAASPLKGRVATGGDHRIAMAFGVLSRLPANELTIDDRRCVAVSYPGFWTDLDRVLIGEERA